jgi:hypothetical protein
MCSCNRNRATGQPVTYAVIGSGEIVLASGLTEMDARMQSSQTTGSRFRR